MQTITSTYIEPRSYLKREMRRGLLLVAIASVAVVTLLAARTSHQASPQPLSQPRLYSPNGHLLPSAMELKLIYAHSGRLESVRCTLPDGRTLLGTGERQIKTLSRDCDRGYLPPHL
jgi:hypothetical protein